MVVKGGGGELLLADRAEATGYLYLSGEADEIASSLGLRGLSLRVSGWTAVEAAEIALDRRATGDLTYGYLQYRLS